MNDQQAFKILSALANGTHPITGEIFADDSPYQSPPVIRALFVALRALEHTDAAVKNAPNTMSLAIDSAKAQKVDKQVDKHVAVKNVGKPWSSDEDKALLAAFDAHGSLADLAKAHGRTQNGVRARLEKHGRLPPSDATRWTGNASKAPSQVRDDAYSA